MVRSHQCRDAPLHPFGITGLPFQLPSASINNPTRAMSLVDRYIAYSGCTESGIELFLRCFERSKSCIPMGLAKSDSSASKISLPVSFSKAVSAALKSQF